MELSFISRKGITHVGCDRHCLKLQLGLHNRFDISFALMMVRQLSLIFSSAVQRLSRKEGDDLSS